MKTNFVGKWIKPLFVVLLALSVSSCSLANSIPDNGGNTPEVSTTLTPGSIDLGDSGSALQNIPLQVGFGVKGPFYEIYFTDPSNPEAFREEGGLDTRLVDAIDAARISVDVAAYSLSLYSIRQAILNAHNRGVRIRMVMESENMTDTVPQALQDAGIPMVGDQRPGLMHNKFVIIDQNEVWTGSMNFTTSGAYEDNNNLIRIRSIEVAKDYTVEFEEMFIDDFFGQDVVAETPYSSIKIDGTYLDVFFSPDDHPAKRIASLLRGAEQSIYIMAYSLTANDFGDIIRQKAQNGLAVKGIMDESQVKSTGSEFKAFTEAGLPVYIDANPGLMHHKVIIIDRQIVITGSYNFTSSAERNNDENVIIIYDKLIASQYLAEFDRLYAIAQKQTKKP